MLVLDKVPYQSTLGTYLLEYLYTSTKKVLTHDLRKLKLSQQHFTSLHFTQLNSTLSLIQPTLKPTIHHITHPPVTPLVDPRSSLTHTFSSYRPCIL